MTKKQKINQLKRRIERQDEGISKIVNLHNELLQTAHDLREENRKLRAALRAMAEVV